MITVQTKIEAPIKKIWELWTIPSHIQNWYNASEDWHVPYAENNLKVNGKFKTTMAAKDGSFSFDLEGVYTTIKKHKLIEFTLSDERKVSVAFIKDGEKIKIVEKFQPESTSSLGVQKEGWEAILDNFKKYVGKQK